MAITNQERVGKAMELLRAGLAPFVEREFKSLHQAQAAEAARRYLGDDRTARQEADRRLGRGGAAQAHVGGVERRLPQDARPRRALAGAASCATAATSGRTRSRSPSDDADRALDSMARLLTAVSAPQADEVGKMKMELRRAASSTSRCAARSARPAAR